MILFIPYWMDGRLVMIMTVLSSWYKFHQFQPKIIYTKGLNIVLYVIGLDMSQTLALGTFVKVMGMFLGIVLVFLHVETPTSMCHARWARTI